MLSTSIFLFVFSWFQVRNHWKRLKMNKKGWKKCLHQLSGAQNLKTGQNTQQLIATCCNFWTFPTWSHILIAASIDPGTDGLGLSLAAEVMWGEATSIWRTHSIKYSLVNSQFWYYNSMFLYQEMNELAALLGSKPHIFQIYTCNFLLNWTLVGLLKTSAVIVRPSRLHKLGRLHFDVLAVFTLIKGVRQF